MPSSGGFYLVGWLDTSPSSLVFWSPVLQHVGLDGFLSKVLVDKCVHASFHGFVLLFRGQLLFEDVGFHALP